MLSLSFPEFRRSRPLRSVDAIKQALVAFGIHPKAFTTPASKLLDATIWEDGELTEAYYLTRQLCVDSEVIDKVIEALPSDYHIHDKSSVVAVLGSAEQQAKMEVIPVFWEASRQLLAFHDTVSQISSEEEEEYDTAKMKKMAKQGYRLVREYLVVRDQAERLGSEAETYYLYMDVMNRVLPKKLEVTAEEVANRVQTAQSGYESPRQVYERVIERIDFDEYSREHQETPSEDEQEEENEEEVVVDEEEEEEPEVHDDYRSMNFPIEARKVRQKFIRFEKLTPQEYLLAKSYGGRNPGGLLDSNDKRFLQAKRDLKAADSILE